MEEAVIKPKRTRAKRRPVEWPSFYRTPNKNVVIDKLELGINSSNHNAKYKCSPYMKYIPVYYLSVISDSLQYYHEGNFMQFLMAQNKGFSSLNLPNPELYTENFNKLIYNYMQTVGGYSLDNSNKRSLVSYLRNTVMVESRPMGACTSRYTNTIGGLINAFSGIEYYGFSLRGSGGHNRSGYVGMFCLDLNGKPLIQAVVRGNEYIYHRANNLLGIPIDMSKVIILVDRRLDNTDIDEIPLSFKTIYQKKLEPIITSTSATIMKVPLDYIIDNCFIKEKFEIKAKKIAEREQEIERFLTSFYQENLGTPVNNSTYNTVLGNTAQYSFVGSDITTGTAVATNVVQGFTTTNADGTTGNILIDRDDWNDEDEDEEEEEDEYDWEDYTEADQEA